VLGAINIVLASGRIGREGCGYATITGQGNGQGGREHGQKCDQLPGGATSRTRSTAPRRQGLGVGSPEEIPAAGRRRYEMFRKIDRGEIKGLLSICFNPKVSLPDNAFVTRMLEKLEFYVAIDFFLNETARHADVVLPGSLHEEDEGTSRRSRAASSRSTRPSIPRRREAGLADHPGHRRGARPRTGFTFDSPREIFDELRRASRAASADYSGITYEKIERQYGVFWPCPTEDHPGTPRLFEPGSWNPVAKGAGPFYFPDGKARFNVAEYTPPAEDVDEEYPIILTTGRVVSQFLSARRRGGSARWWTSTPSRASRCTRAWRRSWDRRRRLGDGRIAPRQLHAALRRS
jgi:assimilatory nitrate reductase catalytic subunit